MIMYIKFGNVIYEKDKESFIGKKQKLKYKDYKVRIKVCLKSFILKLC